MDAGVGVASPEMESIAATILNIPARDDIAECSTPNIPIRLRRRLLEPKTHTISAQDIESKLHDAYLRRQQIYESLSKKARSKSRSGSASSNEKYLHLQAKHKAAEQKRLTILGQIQNRLARLDQLRQDAKNGARLRFLKERNELSTKVELRLQQAEANRLLLLNAIIQRQVAKREKASQSLTRKQNQQKKYKDCIRAAIHQKRAAAQRKRLGFLEAQQIRARASALQVQQAARSQDIERKKVMGNSLQRAKRNQPDNLAKNESLHNPGQAPTETVKQMQLFNKLIRCWRRFVRLKGTTFSLAKAFENLEINQESVKSMPFERLADLLGSGDTISKVKTLLHRIESHVTIRHETNRPNYVFHMENIDHLLKRVAISGKRVVGNSNSYPARTKLPYSNKPAPKSTKICRYPVRVVLGAYIISGHPDVASCEMGNYETGLVRAAEEFLQAFESLVKIMLQEPVQSSEPTVGQTGFNSQLGVFDRVWCLYLRQFVTWKVKDSKSLEDDLVRAASQLESTMDSYNKILEGDAVENQTKEHHVSAADSSRNSSGEDENVTNGRLNVGHVTESMLNREISNSRGKIGSDIITTADENQSLDVKLVKYNVAIVNELVHGHHSSLADSLIFANEDQGSIKSSVREIMEKAFWDGVMETLKQDKPDYSWVLKLIEEVRDELIGLSPSNWRQEIDRNINLDTLSEVLQKDTLNIEDCGRILKFSLDTLQKLSAPAKEEELKTAHEKLLRELAEISQDESNPTFALVIMRGLRFVLKEIQALKHEMSKVRLNMLEPLIRGSAGLEYLRSNFASSYGSAHDARSRLPLVSQWLSSVVTESEQNWSEHMESLLDVKSRDGEYSVNYSPTILRTGGSVLRVSMSSSPASVSEVEQPECKGERLDLLLRFGLLKLVNQVEGLTAESLPETLQLNLLRLRNIQSQLQKIIVICTSILVLRQTLISEHLVTNAQEMETVISDCVERLSQLLDNVENVGLSEIVKTMNCYSNNGEDPEKSRERKDIMSNMLGRSLSAGDAIFTQVSRSVYLAARGVVLGGSGQQGRKLAEAALKRVGAALLTEKLVNAVQELVVMANVTKSVHLAWYEQLLENIVV